MCVYYPRTLRSESAFWMSLFHRIQAVVSMSIWYEHTSARFPNSWTVRLHPILPQAQTRMQKFSVWQNENRDGLLIR